MSKKSNLKKEKTKIVPGTIRIRVKDLTPYEKTPSSWKKSSRDFKEAMVVIKLFKAHNNFNALIDEKNTSFLKGRLSPDGKPQGARINILPNGRRLNKAYSLFAPHLTIHDETSNHHWDVIYQNQGGTYSYLYTLEKRNNFVTKKYKVVKEFTKYYPKLKRNVYNALRDENDHMALPMYTLLKTYMRIGNEIYYKANGHRGLITLKKEDIVINKDYVCFNYIAKDGVPTNVESRFPTIYVLRLQKILRTIKKTSFVFVNKETGHPYSDHHFRDAFKRYCGKEFYPHIVRSYYATIEVKKFIETHRSITKEAVRDLFLSIAKTLGHKRFVKNEGVWKESYSVTISHYVQPDLIEKIKDLLKIKSLPRVK